MALPQPAETASTNSAGQRGDAVRGSLGRYLKDLEGQPLAMRTREAYAAHVSAYAAWLAKRPGAERALREPRARDHAARDFKRHLKLERRWAPSSVNLALAAIDHFNRFLGLGAAVVAREQVAQAAPRALDEADQRALLRAAESPGRVIGRSSWCCCIPRCGCRRRSRSTSTTCAPPRARAGSSSPGAGAPR